MKHRRSPLALLALLAAQASLHGCGGAPPEGQVVATVDGEDVTRRELAAEARAAGVAAEGEAAMRGPILAQLIDRKLLARAARRQRFDRTPEYLDGLRRGRETLLAGLLARQVAGDLPAPTPDAIRAYVRDRPWMFAGRALFLVDAIDLPPGAAAPAIAADATLAGLASSFAAGGAARRRWIDGATLDREEARQLAARDGVVAIRDGGRVALVVVLARRPAPLAPARSESLAAAALRRTAVASALAARVEQERRRAQIRFQPGFGPASQ